jgi:diguanylate cyclase (GGDEF)-like protein/PAS domain S-box-containing protein
MDSPLLGYDAAYFTGRPFVDYIAEQDLVLFRPAIAALLTCASGTSQGFEFRIRHSDGRLLQTECLITNLLDDPDVTGIVINLRDITERKGFEQQLTFQAFHDPVTNLANGALFHDRVEHALTRRRTNPRPVTVLFLDLDDFKAVNDTVGHAAGDRVLQIISSRLRSELRAGDTLARLGGDEFAILLEDVAHETAVTEIVEKLLRAVRPPVTMDDRELSIQCSIGIAVARSPGRPPTPAQPPPPSICCATRMSRCTKRRPPAATPTATSSQRCTRPSSNSSRCAPSSRRPSQRRS